MNTGWKQFDKRTSRGKQLPPERKYVLVQCTPSTWGQAPPVAVGYLRFSGGDKNSPFFVVPGVDHSEVIAWLDCLPDELKAPLWNPESEGLIRDMWNRKT